MNREEAINRFRKARRMWMKRHTGGDIGMVEVIRTCELPMKTYIADIIGGPRYADRDKSLRYMLVTTPAMMADKYLGVSKWQKK